MALLCGAVAVLAVACGPPPPTPAPAWTPTAHPWQDGEAGHAQLSATNEDWWAVARNRADGATLLVYPRTGPGGAPAPEPAATIETDGRALALAMSDEVIAYRADQNDPDAYHVGLVELQDTTWVAAGWIARPMVEGSSVALDLTDDAVAVGLRAPGAQPALPGRTEVVALDRSGPHVAWDPSQVQVLEPEPTWPTEARHRFGDDVSIQGDLLAVGTEWDRATLYRRGAAGWSLEHELLGGDPLGGAYFARAVSLDGAGTERVALGSAGGWDFGVPQPGEVRVFDGTGAGWQSTHRIEPRPGSGLNGLAMGSDVALHGDRLAVAAHWTPVPRPGGVGQVDDLRVEVHDLGRSATFEAELSLLDALGGVEALPGVSTVAAMDLSLAGTHLGVTVWVGFGADPARGAAISYDLR